MRSLRDCLVCYLGFVLGTVVILTVPVFLVSGNVRWAFNEERLYAYGFDKYSIAESTGFRNEELLNISSQMMAYWASDEDLVDVTVRSQPLFNAREKTHLKDVKSLVLGFELAWWVSGSVILLCGILSMLKTPFANFDRFYRNLRTGSLLTIGLLITVGVIVLVAFRWVFILFHRISFRNDFWQLDPKTDYLVRLFPEGFWFDAALFLGLATLLEAVILFAIVFLLIRMKSQRRIRGKVS